MNTLLTNYKNKGDIYDSSKAIEQLSKTNPRSVELALMKEIYTEKLSKAKEVQSNINHINKFNMAIFNLPDGETKSLLQAYQANVSNPKYLDDAITRLEKKGNMNVMVQELIRLRNSKHPKKIL